MVGRRVQQQPKPLAANSAMVYYSNYSRGDFVDSSMVTSREGGVRLSFALCDALRSQCAFLSGRVVGGVFFVGVSVT